jgi:hypothetical protein
LFYKIGILKRILPVILKFCSGTVRKTMGVPFACRRQSPPHRFRVPFVGLLTLVGEQGPPLAIREVTHCTPSLPEQEILNIVASIARREFAQRATRRKESNRG